MGDESEDKPSAVEGLKGRAGRERIDKLPFGDTVNAMLKQAEIISHNYIADLQASRQAEELDPEQREQLDRNFDDIESAIDEAFTFLVTNTGSYHAGQSEGLLQSLRLPKNLDALNDRLSAARTFLAEALDDIGISDTQEKTEADLPLGDELKETLLEGFDRMHAKLIESTRAVIVEATRNPGAER